MLNSNTGNQALLTKTELIRRSNYLEIAKGNVTGTSIIHKFGQNLTIDTGTPADIWDFETVYVYSTTADIDTLSSSNAGDKQDIIIYGLDTNWEEVVQTITLNGQTKVSLTTSLVRVYRMKNLGTTDIAGVVYCYVDCAIVTGVPGTDNNVRAIISGSNNQTLMAIYTIPAGYTGYLINSYVSLTKARAGKAGELMFRARPYGGVFLTKATIGMNSAGTSYIDRTRIIPNKIPEKTDIAIHCPSVTANDTSISAGFEIILIKN